MLKLRLLKRADAQEGSMKRSNRSAGTISVSTDRLIEACKIAQRRGYVFRDQHGRKLKDARQVVAVLAWEGDLKIDREGA